MGGDAVQELARAAASAWAEPDDLGLWFDLCVALDAAGDSETAAGSFSALGQAACDLGAVALAVACAWRLVDEPREALLARVGSTHCKQAEAVDSSARRRPPTQKQKRRAPPPIPADRPGAVKLAQDAIAVATRSARDRVRAELAPTPLVRALEPEEFTELCGAMTLRRWDRGDVVMDVGDPAESLFWIARGAVSVTRGEHHLGDVRSNALFGEIALVADTTRTATVTCSEVTWLLTMPRSAIEDLAGRVPRLGTVLANYARGRLLSNVMRTSELFSRLSEHERLSLLPRFQTRFFPEGEVIVTRGQSNDSLYVVVSGRCDVRTEDDEVTAVLGVGDGIGEMSVISRKPATADVIATRNVVALVLDREVFDSLAVEHPGLLAEVYKLLVTREQHNRDAMAVHDAEDLVI